VWGAVRYIPHSVMDNLYQPIYFHFWFMFSLIGLYLLFPFLAQGLKAFSDKGLLGLMILLLVLEGLGDFLPAFGKNFSYGMEFGWIIYAIFGYAFTREYFQKRYKIFLMIGIAAFAVQVAVLGALPGFSALILHQDDLNPWEVLAVCGVFAFFMLWSSWKKDASEKNGWIGHVVHFLSAYTFSVYLIHGHVITWWSRNGLLINLHISHVKLWWILTVLCVFGLSLLFSIVFDNVIVSNVQRFFVWFNEKIYRLFKKN
jgi:peptidoglycan/LPS O-acetylase OafA/YrhL